MRRIAKAIERMETRRRFPIELALICGGTSLPVPYGVRSNSQSRHFLPQPAIRNAEDFRRFATHSASLGQRPQDFFPLGMSHTIPKIGSGLHLNALFEC